MSKKLKLKESVRYLKEGLEFEVIHESDDDEGNPTLWGAEVNSHHYGKFMWIELSDVDGYYDLVYNAGGDRYKTIKSFRTFNSAKRFAEDLIRQEKIEYDIDESLNEGAVSASLVNLKNQLMNKLGAAFTVIGGGMIPKVTIYADAEPDEQFEITTDGKNVDVLPKHDGIPDTAHKKRGIAFMRAANVIYDFIMDALGGGRTVTAEGRKASTKLRISEGRDNFEGSPLEAADFYYSAWKYGEISNDEIRRRLSKLGYDDDFADSVLEIIGDKFNDEDLYWDEYDECVDKKLRESDGKQIKYRIDYYGSWDNGRVLHSYKKGTLDDAEEEARKASLKDTNNLFYVVRDNIMDPTTDWSWYRGKKYHYIDDEDKLNSIKKDINNR